MCTQGQYPEKDDVPRFARYKLFDWWDMKPFPVQRLISLVRLFESSSGQDSTTEAPLSATDKQTMIAYFYESAKEFEELSLFSAADQMERLAEAADDASDSHRVYTLLPEALNRLEDECKRHVVMMIEPEYVRYYNNPQFFDPKDPALKKVSIQFPSAAEDIAEAGKCLACQRSTACVMHLNRVVENGLAALASALGVPKQTDWGAYLRKIDEELANRLVTSGARSPDEQFYAEVKITFDGVRRAWRNPTMHPDKTYTMERAEEIMLSVRSFMRHLANNLSD